MREVLTGTQGAKDFLRFPSRFLIAIVVSSVLLLGASAQGNSFPGSHSRDSERAALVRVLNNGVLQLHGQMQENASGAAGVRGQAASVLAKRAAALKALMEENPRAALSFAFSPELLADLAAKFPDSAAQLESHAALSGTIEQWTFDTADGKNSHSEYRMKVGAQSLSLHFAGNEPNLTKGNVFRVTGVVVLSDMAVSESSAVPSGTASNTGSSGVPAERMSYTSGFLPVARWPALALVSLFAMGLLYRMAGRRKVIGPIRQIAACCAIAAVVLNPNIASAQTCSTTGAQNVAVLLVTFPGVTPPANITQQSVYNMFFSTTGPSLDGYWREASYGQTSATGNVFGWFTLDSSYADCTRMDLLRDAAIAAAANSGVPIQNYNRIFIVSTDFGCSWTGLSLGMCSSLNSPNGSFVASTSFLNASWQRSQIEGAENAAHEGGHNMGLAHAQSRTFGTEPLGALGAPGTVMEYGDPFSDMASSNSGHYATPHKAEILNWISSGINYQVVQSSGTWTLQPLEVNPAGLVALKVQRGTGNNSWIWVEFRQPIGIYESIWAPAGALIHYEDSTTSTHTQLLDFTPATSGMYDSALMPANTWTDPYSNVSISVQGATANALTVSVSYGATPCTASTPSIAVSPLDPSIYPGQTATYSAVVTNNDSSGCSASAIRLASTEPSGWSTSLSTASVNLAPGQSTSVALSKGAPSGTPAGTYAVDLSASSSVATGSATANATVLTPPSLTATVSVSGTSFSRPGIVPISASVLSGGSPVPGSSVTFTITTPSGSTASQSATTGSNGVATWNYRLNQKSQAGTYSVTARAALSSGSKKSASTQFVAGNAITFAVN
jgi:M6 family metalloprotease-like protein